LTILTLGIANPNRRERDLQEQLLPHDELAAGQTGSRRDYTAGPAIGVCAVLFVDNGYVGQDRGAWRVPVTAAMCRPALPPIL